MDKITYAILIMYNLLRQSIKKVVNFKKCNIAVIQLISPYTELKIRGKKSKLRIGRLSNINRNVTIKVTDGELIIGKNVFINNNSMIVCREKITIGNGTTIGPNVVIYDHDHNYSRIENQELYATSEVSIGSNVWIGAGSIILRGSKIEDNCVIAAGSIVSGLNIKENNILIQKRKSDIISKREEN